jgi:hypothetical protein
MGCANRIQAAVYGQSQIMAKEACVEEVRTNYNLPPRMETMGFYASRTSAMILYHSKESLAGQELNSIGDPPPKTAACFKTDNAVSRAWCIGRLEALQKLRSRL